MSINKLLKSSKALVLDTGVLIEYFKTKEDKLKQLLRETIFTEESEIKLYVNYLLKSEIFYILCRAIGEETAKETLKEMELFLNIEETRNLHELAGQIKCKFSISLVDCYSIATGILQNCPIIFLTEAELTEDVIERINKEFSSDIHIIDKDHL